MITSMFFSTLIVVESSDLENVIENIIAAIRDVEGVEKVVPNKTIVEMPAAENEIQLKLHQRFSASLYD